MVIDIYVEVISSERLVRGKYKNKEAFSLLELDLEGRARKTMFEKPRSWKACRLAVSGNEDLLVTLNSIPVVL